jgi:hypothetical protein
MQTTRVKSVRRSLLEAEARTEKDIAAMRLPLFGVERAIGIEVYLAASCFERGITRMATSANTATVAVVRARVELAHERRDSGAFLSVEVADRPTA